MRSLGDLLPILFIVVFGLLAKSAQRTALKRQKQGSAIPPQAPQKAAAGAEKAAAKALDPDATYDNLPLTPLESHIMERRREDADRIRSPLWDGTSRQQQAAGRPQDDTGDAKGIAVLPAFSRDALVQAVVLSQVLGPRGGRHAR